MIPNIPATSRCRKCSPTALSPLGTMLPLHSGQPLQASAALVPLMYEPSTSVTNAVAAVRIASRLNVVSDAYANAWYPRARISEIVAVTIITPVKIICLLYTSDAADDLHCVDL